jgi:putative nucleotidyltransferase with HDIG domain
VRELPTKVKIFIYLEWLVFAIIFIIFALVFKAGFFSSIHSPKSIIIILSLTIADIFSDLVPIIYSLGSSENKAEVTLTFAINFALAVLYSPLIAMIISFVVPFLSNLIIKKQWVKTLFDATKISLTVGITSLFFSKYYSHSLSLINPKNLSTIGLGFLIYFSLDSLILFALLSLLNNKPFIPFWYKNIKKVFFTLFALFFLGVVIIFFFQTEPLMNLFIIPTFVAVYLALKREVQITQETENALYALADAVDARIPDTMDHSKRVAILTRDLCNALNVDDERTNIIVMATKLHDIGKVIIPDAILNKNGKLTEEEYEIIKKHSEEGEKIASKLSLFRKGATFIKFHHERFSGGGYPDGLKGEQIPFGARVINIADSFDTMITPRIYRSYTKSMQEALEEVERCKGTQFDPQIADAFIEMVKSDLERYYELIKLGKVTENN